MKHYVAADITMAITKTPTTATITDHVASLTMTIMMTPKYILTTSAVVAMSNYTTVWAPFSIASSGMCLYELWVVLTVSRMCCVWWYFLSNWVFCGWWWAASLLCCNLDWTKIGCWMILFDGERRIIKWCLILLCITAIFCGCANCDCSDCHHVTLRWLIRSLVWSVHNLTLSVNFVCCFCLFVKLVGHQIYFNLDLFGNKKATCRFLPAHSAPPDVVFMEWLLFLWCFIFVAIVMNYQSLV